MKTALCDILGIEHPIVAAPMGPDAYDRNALFGSVGFHF